MEWSTTMAQNKTRPTSQSVQSFIDAIENERKRADSIALVQIMREISDEEPRMWGESMIGFGSYHYQYASGHQGDSFQIGFAPRKAAITLYLMGMYMYSDDPERDHLLDRLGKHKLGKGCLYINKLADVDIDVLKTIIQRALEQLRAHYTPRKTGRTGPNVI